MKGWRNKEGFSARRKAAGKLCKHWTSPLPLVRESAGHFISVGDSSWRQNVTACLSRGPTSPSPASIALPCAGLEPASQRVTLCPGLEPVTPRQPTAPSAPHPIRPPVSRPPRSPAAPRVHPATTPATGSGSDARVPALLPERPAEPRPVLIPSRRDERGRAGVRYAARSRPARGTRSRHASRPRVLRGGGAGERRGRGWRAERSGPRLR